MIIGILVSINTFFENPVHWGYLVSGLALIAIGPIVFLGIRAEEKAKLKCADIEECNVTTRLVQIIDGPEDEATLARLGQEASQLLCSGEIAILAARFGYALAFHRELEVAIREDLENCLRQLESPGLASNFESGSEVKFFQSNDVGLFALIACAVPTVDGKEVLVELIVTAKGADKYITLEDMSVVGATGHELPFK